MRFTQIVGQLAYAVAAMKSKLRREDALLHVEAFDRVGTAVLNDFP